MWLAWPLEIRLALVAVLAALASRGINHLVDHYELSVLGEPRGSQTESSLWSWLPWGPLPGTVGPHASRWRWAIVELVTSGFLTLLYYWQCQQLALWAPGAVLVPDIAVVVHQQFVAHALLITLMLAASLVDLDERIIPDGITVWGTLAGLAIAVLWPASALPEGVYEDVHLATPVLNWLRFSAPAPIPVALAGLRNPSALALGLGCFWLWCFALLPRRWRARRGVAWAWRIFLTRLVRDSYTRPVLVMGAVGTGLVVACWGWGGARWESLLSALVGMMGAASCIWAVRIVGSLVLGREAMGFGDVTLMAMIGAFLGWQVGLMIFFVAPCLALVLGIAQLLLHSDNELPYGPFLCLAAVLLMWFWAGVWEWGRPIFELGWMVPLLMLFCLFLLGILLGLWRLVLGFLTRGRDGLG
jgi:prepilin signal peptidase PulO-like enzyme (type II secretory pathway)